MKHKGANMEYAEERLSDLMRTYDEYISSCDYIRMPEVYAYIANAPAARFYVSDNRATIVVSAMLQDKQHIKMRPLKFEMFQEICRRVLSLRELHPEWSLKMLCAEVVAQPAPKFYISPGSAKIMVCKGRRKWIREKLKRLRHFSL